jgi:hypothetical protein
MGLPYADPTNSGQWAQDLLSSLGDPETASNIGYIEAWEQHESPSGFGYNPLGTEETSPGSIHAPGNTASVQAFDSWYSGLNATVRTFTGDAGNANLEKDLASGDASLAQLSKDQTQGSWATGGESAIASLGTSTNFLYGGAYGLVAGAKGVASTPGDVLDPSPGVKFPLAPESPDPLKYPGEIFGDTAQTASGVAKKLASSVFGPLTGWIEEGAADVTFVGFGLVLVVIGLIVTFKGGGDSSVDPAPVKDAAVAAVA